jgi:hypothetical protein
MRRKIMYGHLKRLLISVICVSTAFLTCGGGIEKMDPTGFGVGADDCSGIAVAVNQADWDGRPLMNHETNERCDLYLCDTNGTILTTLFSARKVDGNPSVIDSLFYDKSNGYVYVYTKMYGTGLLKMERVNLADKTIEALGEMDIIDWPLLSNFKSQPCNGRVVRWNAETNWIEVGNEQETGYE